ncbi:matrix-remodeling-associated protein 7 isoform 1-T1 [Odontesthes bonariensis]|uniref:matrix-remodeling-associated protein 7 isoform X1 n=1 Tax=Odontesthes bonariensis TaxID=219752 RepID=UPI003F585469
MDVTFILSAIIFTLLAVVVATSLFKGSSPAAELANARSYFRLRGDGAAGGLEPPGPKQNGHLAEKKKKEVDDWSQISGSAHDHWDVVKSVLSEEEHSHLHTKEAATAEHSTSSLSVPSSGSRHTSLDVDSSSEASSERNRRSLIGLSDMELLKCAFSYPQTEGATESPGINAEKTDSDQNSLKYVPGRARSHHLERMMSKEELEEEQRVQREQLTAIFQLLKDNKETFGEMSEGDLEDQLRLYSI